MEKEGDGKKILVVDDKEDARGLVKEILEPRGYQVIEAATGEDAVNMAQTELPDLILMDIRLPGGIDGLEATRRIKALPQLAHIPILAMTASVKPEDMDELPRQVAEHIARASSTD